LVNHYFEQSPDDHWAIHYLVYQDQVLGIQAKQFQDEALVGDSLQVVQVLLRVPSKAQ